ncbi:MAG: DUF1836 domain-containing protein [Firmicutes bacterium]|nr:DUF1836 domain-containing protein [Bacillota bacterium]
MNTAIYNENKDTIDSFHIPRWDELPSIDLYMDQIVTYIDSALSPLFGMVGAAPITKSMVNNYVKARIVDAPVNKKYPRLSVAMIIVVYILKSCFATDEIGKLIRYGMGMGEDVSLTYDRFCEAIENGLRAVFSGEVHITNQCLPGRESKYLMDNFALSFASKFYIQKIFFRYDKED